MRVLLLLLLLLNLHRLLLLLNLHWLLLRLLQRLRWLLLHWLRRLLLTGGLVAAATLKMTSENESKFTSSAGKEKMNDEKQ